MLAGVFAYLLGSLSFAVLVSRAFGLPDPRTHGSGNPGATNILRTGRKSAAALTLLGDMAKGWVAVMLAKMLIMYAAAPVWSVDLAAVLVLLGHMYPVFFDFKGGKGVATALGVLLAVSPWLGLACASVWLLVFMLTRVSSLSALLAALSAPVLAYFLLGNSRSVLAMSALAALIVWRHRGNIKRLCSGEETCFKKQN